MSQPDQATILRVARAICASYGDDYDDQPEDLAQLREQRGGDVYSHDPGLPTREDWRNMAIAAIAAYEAGREEPDEGIEPSDGEAGMPEEG